MSLVRSHVLICGGTGCTSSGSMSIHEKFEVCIKKFGLEKEVKVVKTGCFGLCEAGPIVVVYPEGAFYSHVKVEDVERITEEHLYKGRIVKELLFKQALEGDVIKSVNEVQFYKKQKRVVLKNCGIINPEVIEEYIAFDGYKALGKVVTEMTQQEVVDEIKKSGLRGRGGGGFPTGLKWQFTHDAIGEEKYVACNADEGDPGAFMDRSVLEGDPHAIIEAMAIAGYAIGASKGFIYIRAEYPIAVDRLEIALKQAKELGVIGDNIFGTDFSFDLEIRLGAGAFVCGEETALIESIEGRRGMPRPRPPFPANKGIFQMPTLLNNVETYANITQIILNGAEWFRTIGTEKSPGTKVFALGGKINNTGLVEIPMGMTLREVIYDIGGGIPDGKAFKAVQTGGPSGGCLTYKHLDEQITYDNLVSLGSMMGSGGMIVLDEDNCMVDVARFFLDFTVDESCGKCTPCREGTKRMLELLNKICEGRGEIEDIARLENLAVNIKDSALCGLGQTAPNPVLSTIKNFRHEYISHIEDKKCEAGVCKALLKVTITDKCIGCTACTKVCPVDCISGNRKEMHVIDQNLCIKCGACIEKCPVNAIILK
ncbi:NADH-quinone oxidoreductase subunit NuoF [Clostridiaceae bacterium HSG29]|nr:NADH-quinone oxidoreductase subunit NuoF [Clostridiaceae bacterium HSG29]